MMQRRLALPLVLTWTTLSAGGACIVGACSASSHGGSAAADAMAEAAPGRDATMESASPVSDAPVAMDVSQDTATVGCIAEAPDGNSVGFESDSGVCPDGDITI